MSDVDAPTEGVTVVSKSEIVELLETMLPEVVWLEMGGNTGDPWPEGIAKEVMGMVKLSQGLVVGGLL